MWQKEFGDSQGELQSPAHAKDYSPEWCRLGSEEQGSSSVGKALNVAGSELNVSPWYASAVIRVNGIVDILGSRTGAQAADGAK